jgi:hypothetical protein
VSTVSDEYVEPSKRPEPDEFETLYRIMGGRREPRSVLLVVGHLAIKFVAEECGGAPC